MKRSIDEASEELIESLHDKDTLDSALETFESERSAIEIAFEDIHETLRREFKTNDVDTLSERDRIRYEQKLEYETTLKEDRIKELETRIAAFKESHSKGVRVRKKRRRVTRDIATCESLSKLDCKACDWKLLGKARHLQKRLEEKRETMSEDQRQKYDAVLVELKQKGWRIHSI